MMKRLSLCLLYFLNKFQYNHEIHLLFLLVSRQICLMVKWHDNRTKNTGLIYGRLTEAFHTKLFCISRAFHTKQILPCFFYYPITFTVLL